MSYIVRKYRTKLNESGYNVLSVHFIGGKDTLIVVLIFPRGEDVVMPVCKIGTGGELDPYNAILSVCKNGKELNPIQMEGFFPEYEEILTDAYRNNPSFFLTNKIFRNANN